MSEKLKWTAIPDSLARILKDIMLIEELSGFRLAGGY